MLSDKPRRAIGIRGRRYLRRHVLDYIKSIEEDNMEDALDNITYAFIAHFPKPWAEVHDYGEFVMLKARLKKVHILSLGFVVIPTYRICPRTSASISSGWLGLQKGQPFSRKH